MRVLWLSHLVPFPPKGGVLQRTYNMIREISRYHQVTLVAFNQRGFLESSLPDKQDPLQFAVDELSKFVEDIHILEIEENRVPGGRYLTVFKALLKGRAYNMEWLRSAKARRVIQELLAKCAFDVVHIDTVSLCSYADILSDIPVVLNHHNFESAMLRSRCEIEANPLKRLFFKYEASRLLRSERYYCTSSQLNLTCSDDDAEAMSSAIGGGSFISVPNGVDVSYFFPNPAAQITAKSIVIVGGLSWYPNREAVEYFIREIWPLLKETFPGIRVDVVGRGPTEEMRKLANMDDHFQVHGFVDDVRDYLWQAQFYLCPIRTGGGTKLKILDALATGCCIIADPFACKGIKVSNGIDVLFAETPEDYLEVISDLLANPEKEGQLRKAGPELISRYYSYSSIGKHYSKVLDDLVAESQTAGRGE